MKRLILVLDAANSAQGLATTLDLPPEAAANARVIEGKLCIPYGLWPVTITNEDGAPEQVVQRLDKAVADRLVAAFNSLRGRLSRVVSDCAIYMGHPDNDRSRDPAAWKPLGKVVSLEAGNEALLATADLPDDTKALLAANAALAPSPYWGLRRTGETHDGLAVCEPVAVYTWGLTPRPNIVGAAVNEDPAVAEEAAALDAGAARDRDMAVLAAQIAEIESKLQAAESARHAAEQAVLSRDGNITEMKTTIEGLRAELEAARAKLEAATQEQTAAVTAANAAADSVVVALVDAAVAGGRLSAADREHWAARLRATPAAANELFAAAPKTASVVPPQRIAAANAAAAAPAAAFAALVRDHQARTGADWGEAWAVCRRTHSDMYQLMQNGSQR